MEGKQHLQPDFESEKLSQNELNTKPHIKDLERLSLSVVNLFGRRLRKG